MFREKQKDTLIPDVFDVLEGRHRGPIVQAVLDPDRTSYCARCGRPSEVPIMVDGNTHCIGCVDARVWEYAS